MALLTRTEMCPFHGPHSVSIEVDDFEFATGLVIVALAESAHLDEIPTLVREWMNRDGSEAFDIDYEDAEYGTKMIITYAV